MDFRARQRGVLRGMATGMAVTVGGIGAALVLAPPGVLPYGGLGARLAFWSGWALPVLATLMLCVGLLARHRFRSAEDIDGGLGQGTPVARLYQAVLQNTLEQVVLWSVVTLIWAVRMPTPALGVLPVVAILFVAGRGLFITGYAGGAPRRALGFALTFYPSLVMAMLLALEMIGVPFG